MSGAPPRRARPGWCLPADPLRPDAPPRCLQAVVRVGPRMEGQHLSGVLWALATLRLRPPLPWLHLYEAQVCFPACTCLRPRGVLCCHPLLCSRP